MIIVFHHSIMTPEKNVSTRKNPDRRRLGMGAALAIGLTSLSGIESDAARDERTPHAVDTRSQPSHDHSEQQLNQSTVVTVMPQETTEERRARMAREDAADELAMIHQLEDLPIPPTPEPEFNRDKRKEIIDRILNKLKEKNLPALHFMNLEGYMQISIDPTISTLIWVDESTGQLTLQPSFGWGYHGENSGQYQSYDEMELIEVVVELNNYAQEVANENLEPYYSDLAMYDYLNTITYTSSRTHEEVMAQYEQETPPPEEMTPADEEDDYEDHETEDADDEQDEESENNEAVQ